MRYQQSMAARQHLEKIEFKQKMLGMQVVSIGMLVFAAIVVWLITSTWPEFFPYGYLSWKVSLEVLYGFWPLALWGLVLGTFATLSNGVASSRHDESLLAWSLTTGWVAAFWEEIGFRWLYICFGMISVVIMNWLFGTVLGWGLAVFFLLVAVKMVYDHEFGLGALALIPMIMCCVFALQEDPLYWFYEVALMPLLNLVSFGAYSNIINPNLYPPLLVMGGIVANAWFRDGHKYQGLVGFFDSWVLGFVFLYAMFTYGLMTAIVLHGLWNTLIALLGYVFAKVSRIA